MSKIVCRKACFFTFWIVCWVTSPLPLGRAEAKATDMVGFFYVPIIYRFRALIILLLSGRYCRAKILRSAWGGEPAQMVRSAPRNEPWAPHHQAGTHRPRPAARAAGSGRGGGGGDLGRGAGGGRRRPAAASPPRRTWCVPAAGLPVAAERRLPAFAGSRRLRQLRKGGRPGTPSAPARG